jgi:hypothetical protein
MMGDVDGKAGEKCSQPIVVAREFAVNLAKPAAKILMRLSRL